MLPIATQMTKSAKELTMRRKGIALFAALLLVVFTSTAAFASSVHFKGDHSVPSFTDNGLTLTSFGELSGLGTGDVLVTLSAQGNPTATCTNPAGQTQPPGQNPAPVTVSGSEAIPASAIKNGNTPFSVTTVPPVSPIPGAPGCPNPMWTEAITDMVFTSAVVTVQQPVGTTVLTASCRFSPPTSNGAVPGSTVTCTVS
jgi:hypothetical protein